MYVLHLKKLQKPKYGDDHIVVSRSVSREVIGSTEMLDLGGTEGPGGD